MYFNKIWHQLYLYAAALDEDGRWVRLKIVPELIEGNWTEGLVLVVVVKEKHIIQSKVGVHVVTRTYT